MRILLLCSHLLISFYAEILNALIPLIRVSVDFNSETPYYLGITLAASPKITLLISSLADCVYYSRTTSQKDG